MIETRRDLDFGSPLLDKFALWFLLWTTTAVQQIAARLVEIVARLAGTRAGLQG